MTETEIEEADCVIVAADANVPMERFDGKHLIECPVSDGISKAEQLMDRAMRQEAPIYQSDSPKTERKNSSAGHKVYTQLMNGVSHMLPFVVGEAS